MAVSQGAATSIAVLLPKMQINADLRGFGAFASPWSDISGWVGAREQKSFHSCKETAKRRTKFGGGKSLRGSWGLIIRSITVLPHLREKKETSKRRPVMSGVTSRSREHHMSIPVLRLNSIRRDYRTFASPWSDDRRAGASLIPWKFDYAIGVRLLWDLCGKSPEYLRFCAFGVDRRSRT